MKIFVCIKQVPDTETKVKISADGKSLETQNIKWVMNPYDEYAVEEAIKIRDAQPGSQIFVVSLGPKKRTVESLRTALAMGADEAIAIDSAEFLDPLLSAQALSLVIQMAGGFDIILAGKLSIDTNSSSVPQMLAQYLKIPHVSVVSKIQLQDKKLTAERDVEGGTKEVVEISLPCVISANKGLNTPRYASLPGIMKAKKKTIKEIEWASLDLSPASWNLIKLELPAEKPAGQMLSGSAQEQVSALVQKLRNEAKVLS